MDKQCETCKKIFFIYPSQVGKKKFCSQECYTKNKIGRKSSRLDDLTGRSFGHWTVIRRIKVEGKKDTYWSCQCGCGKISNVTSHSLKSGGSKSCGCKSKEKINYTIPDMKICTVCKDKKKLNLFPKKTAKRDGRAAECKECHSIRAKKYRASWSNDRRERYKKYSRKKRIEWYEKHKNRLKTNLKNSVATTTNN